MKTTIYIKANKDGNTVYITEVTTGYSTYLSWGNCVCFDIQPGENLKEMVERWGYRLVEAPNAII